ncbi:hypothetical protein [Bdellovibrio svalbardensis]|uniref:Outer membrane protein beta-barrel domain-containing protein n=1 Tax=Bdellovibrio svalbardensis TaxID=2972972 RepID=A0ABT6DH70_9BACT|nr:hypothetical protein [Bdellovibrio svalbardensis]MDG0816162.1 hypothetical protein [Bdellovibrio svalbardensis]
MKFILTFSIIILLQCQAVADWKFGVSAGASPNYLVSLKGNGVSSGAAYSIEYELKYGSGADFGVDLWNTPQDSWGFISGLQYGADRELKSGTANGVVLNVGTSVSKYQTHYVYLGTAYRWSSFYIPLAVSYGFTHFTPAPSSLNAGQIIITENGPGVQLGVGWFIGEHIVIEYVGRAVTTAMNVTAGADSEKTKGMISSALLNLKLLY